MLFGIECKEVIAAILRREERDVSAIVIRLARARRSTAHDFDGGEEWEASPTIGKAVGYLGGFCAREMQVDEPFRVNPLRRFFEQGNLSAMVFNQAVVRFENLNNFVLCIYVGAKNL